MNREEYLRELAYLLQDMSDEERQEALLFYENYFDEAGEENEQKVILELGTPKHLAKIIKDGLGGQFEEHIHAGNQGFSNDDYDDNYEVVDVDQNQKNNGFKSIKRKWNEMDSRDRLILGILLILVCVPVSFSILGIIGGVFGTGFSVVAAIFMFVFGFWIVTFVLHVIAIILIVMGVLHLFSVPGAGCIYIGVGCILIALGSIFGKIAIWFFKDCIPKVANAIADGLGKIIHPRGV